MVNLEHDSDARNHDDGKQLVWYVYIKVSVYNRF